MCAEPTREEQNIIKHAGCRVSGVFVVKPVIGFCSRQGYDLAADLKDADQSEIAGIIVSNRNCHTTNRKRSRKRSSRVHVWLDF